MPDHCGELIFREKVLELSRQEDSWSPPTGGEGGIGQRIDNANALNRLTRSLCCSLEHCSNLRPRAPKAAEHVSKLSRRSKPVHPCVHQSHE